MVAAARTGAMQAFLLVLILIGAAATAWVLFRGILTMARGRDVTGVQSNRLMTARVLLQAITIILVVILFILGGRGMSGG